MLSVSSLHVMAYVKWFFNSCGGLRKVFFSFHVMAYVLGLSFHVMAYVK